MLIIVCLSLSVVEGSNTIITNGQNSCKVRQAHVLNISQNKWQSFNHKQRERSPINLRQIRKKYLIKRIQTF